jgi:hypothetical protein
MTESAMYWGFSCEDGWFDLIDKLCANLQAAAEKGEIPQPVAEQVKQKFGELRFYVSTSSSALTRTMIEATRAQSAVTCEVCGEPGVLRWQSGVQTVCDRHALPGSRIVVEGEPRPRRP